MATVEYSRQGQANLREIIGWHLLNSRDEETALRTIATLLKQIEALAENPLLGTRISPKMPPERRSWLVLNERYKVYYERLADDHIYVVMVRPTRRAPISQAEIERVFNIETLDPGAEP